MGWVWERLADLREWLTTPAKQRPREQWSSHADHCPTCGQELPTFRPSETHPAGMFGPIYWEPPERDGGLRARCPFCGIPGARRQAREMLRDGRLPFTRRDGRWPDGWDPDEP